MCCVMEMVCETRRDHQVTKLAEITVVIPPQGPHVRVIHGLKDEMTCFVSSMRNCRGNDSGGASVRLLPCKDMGGSHM